MRLRFVFQEIGIGLRRNLTMTLAVVISVAVSLSLFGVALLVRAQVSTMKDYWYDKVEVSIFLCNQKSQSIAGCAGGPVTEEQRASILSDLKKMQGQNGLVKDIFQESKADAYKRVKEQFRNSPIAEFVTPDQMQDSFRVKLNNPTQYNVVAEQFQGRPGVNAVQDQRRILGPFFAILRVFQYGAAAISVVMLLVAVLLIANTMRVAAFSRRRETGIMRLVGASNFYIQLPFLMEGAVAGLAGALFASISVVLLKVVGIDQWLAPRLTLTAFVGWDAVVSTLLWLVVFGVAMSVIASFITLRKYLRV
jgi:cell division transport system permease protein